MKALEIKEGINLLTIPVEGLLFEGIWDIPKGVTINSYIVKGEKTAIIDGFCGWDGVPEKLFKLLDEVNVELEDIEYVVINHMEPDHSGWLNDFKKIKKDFKIYCTKESAKLLDKFFSLTENVITIKDKDVLDLGGGKSLEFIKIPHCHWPDTMATFEKSTSTLFSCDMFGSFGITNKIYSDELKEEELKDYFKEMKRYYSNIMATFSPMVIKGTNKIKEYNPKLVAPGHGVLWREDVDTVLDKYIELAEFQSKPKNNSVCIVFGTMYGMSEKALEFTKNVLKENNVDYKVIYTNTEPIGTALKKSYEAKGVIILAPTYEYKLFPPAAYVLDEMSRKKYLNRKAIYLGSYGWSGGAFREVNEINERTKMKWEILGNYEYNGSPDNDDFLKIKEGVLELIQQIK